MAARKGGRGNGEVHDLTVEILKGIRGELVTLRGEVVTLRGELVVLRDHVDTGLQGVKDEVQQLNTRVDSLERETARGFEAVTRRLEHIADFSGERWREHEGRLRKIEERLKIA